MRDTVAQSPPATNYENSGVVSEMIGSDAAGRVAYTDEVVAEFSTPAVQARVDAVARKMRQQLKRGDFLLASNKPYLEEVGRRLDFLLGRRTEGDSSSSHSLVAAMCSEGRAEHATRTLIQNVSGLLASSVDATSLVRAVRAFNAMIDEAATCLDAPSEEMYAIRGVLMGLLDAVEGKGGTKSFSIPIDAAHPPRERLSPIQFPEEGHGVVVRAPVIFPGTTIATPTAYGARWGQVYGSLSSKPPIFGLHRSNWYDGTISFGFGLGDPEKWVALDVALNVLDSYTDFGNERALSLKVHRKLHDKISVALGYENIWSRVADRSEGGRSLYGVIAKRFEVQSRSKLLRHFLLSVGLGSDRFLSVKRFEEKDLGVNFFASSSFELAPFASMIVNWTGQDLAIGTSIRPSQRFPVVITPALVDVTGRAREGLRFSIGIATTYDFRR